MAQSVKCLMCQHEDLSPRSHTKNEWQGSSVTIALWEERGSRRRYTRTHTQINAYTPLSPHTYITNVWENTIKWILITALTYRLKKLEILIYREIAIFSCQYAVVFKEMMSSFLTCWMFIKAQSWLTTSVTVVCCLISKASPAELHTVSKAESAVF